MAKRTLTLEPPEPLGIDTVRDCQRLLAQHDDELIWLRVCPALRAIGLQMGKHFSVKVTVDLDLDDPAWYAEGRNYQVFSEGTA